MEEEGVAEEEGTVKEEEAMEGVGARGEVCSVWSS